MFFLLLSKHLLGPRITIECRKRVNRSRTKSAMFHQTLSYFGAYSALLVYELMSMWRRVRYHHLGYPHLQENDAIRSVAAHRVDENTMNFYPEVVMLHRKDCGVHQSRQLDWKQSPYCSQHGDFRMVGDSTCSCDAYPRPPRIIRILQSPLDKIPRQPLHNNFVHWKASTPTEWSRWVRKK